MKFPRHLLTKRIKQEILEDACKLALITLPEHLRAEEAFRPLPPGTMLTLKFSPNRESGDWLRVAFEERTTELGNYCFRIGYDAACCGLPVTKTVLSYSVRPDVCKPFNDMIKSGMQQKHCEKWVYEVARLAHYSASFGAKWREFENGMSWDDFNHDMTRRNRH